jgi:hypothetical protein
MDVDNINSNLHVYQNNNINFIMNNNHSTNFLQSTQNLNDLNIINNYILSHMINFTARSLERSKSQGDKK